MSTPAAHLRTALCDLLGIEHPIVGFSPSEHVAAAVSRAGGLGVLGCVRFALGQRRADLRRHQAAEVPAQLAAEPFLLGGVGDAHALP